MKVGIYTNLHERCGNAEYARDLYSYLNRVSEFTVYLSDNLSDLMHKFLDVLLINYHPARVPISRDIIMQIKQTGARVIIINQNSYDAPFRVDDDDVMKAADAVVAHEPMDANFPIEVIPHGIPECSTSHHVLPMIGFAGFPFKWKRVDVVAEVAKRLNVKCRLIVPIYPGQDTESYVRGISGHLGDLAEVYTDYMPTSQVVWKLSECAVNIFWFNSYGIDDQLGQSGSVRLGLAAKRPIVLSTHRKFKTLTPYDDELYFCDTEEKVHSLVKAIFNHLFVPIVPNRVLRDQRWTESAKKYVNLIERVATQ